MMNHNNNNIIIVLIVMMLSMISSSSFNNIVVTNKKTNDARLLLLLSSVSSFCFQQQQRPSQLCYQCNSNNNNLHPPSLLLLLLYGKSIRTSRSMSMRRMTYRDDNNNNNHDDGQSSSFSSDDDESNDNDDDDLSISTLIKFDTIEELMLQYDPILLFASKLLLPSSADNNKAKDAAALYAWCRRLDEIVDSNNTSNNEIIIQKQLDLWKIRFDKLWDGQPVDEIDNELTKCIQRYSSSNTNTNNKSNNIVLLTKEPFEDMISGMRSDIDVNNQRRIANLDELEIYSYRVAGTVGVMLLPLLEAPIEAKDPAICLGKAIQLINILRDANPDIKLGRIYLPQDLLQIHNVKESDILLQASADETTTPPVVSEGYKEVVKIVAIRAEELLVEAEIGGKKYLPGLGPLFVQIIVELYRGYLNELEKRNYDNLTIYNEGQDERVKISKLQKFVAVIKAIQKIYLS